MPTRTRNEFLDGDESDGDAQSGYDSEAKEESRGALVSRPSKRRKTDSDSERSFGAADDDESDDHGNAPVSDSTKVGTHDESRSDMNGKEEEDDDDEEEDAVEQKNDLARATRKMAKQLQASQKAVHKSGVIYISRVPPFMKPHTLKHFLEPHASKGLGRIFLTPEDHAAHTRRVKSGGNKKKSFTDGWVEFNSKKEAKIAAEMLNGNTIGGKKGNFYYDDLWNIKYLRGFKWNHLTEQISNENAERAARLREEIRKTREENRAFVEDVERSKMLQGMEKKKKAKGASVGQIAPVEKDKTKREFKQQKARTAESATKPGESAKSALNMIFG